MNREQLGRAIKAACANLDESPVIVLGSQSILGSYDTSELPEVAFKSREVDILPLSGITDPPSLEEKLLTLDARLGEDSPFHDAHGFYVEGIHKDIVVLPKHWDNRLVHFTVADGSSELYGRTGLCLDPVDLCVSKTIAGRDKDREFVGALVRDNIVTAAEILDRIDQYGIEWPGTYTSDKDVALGRARSWLEYLNSEPGGASPAGLDLVQPASTPERSIAPGESTPSPERPSGFPTIRQMLKGQAGRAVDTGRGPAPDASPARDRGAGLGD